MPNVAGGGYPRLSRRQLYFRQIGSCPVGTGMEGCTFINDLVQYSSIQTSLMSVLFSTAVISAPEN